MACQELRDLMPSNEHLGRSPAKFDQVSKRCVRGLNSQSVLWPSTAATGPKRPVGEDVTDGRSSANGDAQACGLNVCIDRPGSFYFEFLALAGLSVLIASRRRTVATSEESLNFARFDTAARRMSRFLTGTPASRQRFLSAAICSYSPSGMVKLSRTSLAFFTLAGFPTFLSLAMKGFGSCATSSAGGDFLAVERVTVFVAVEETLAAAGLLADFGAAGATDFAALGRAAGLGGVALPDAGAAGFVSVGVLVSAVMVILYGLTDR